MKDDDIVAIVILAVVVMPMALMLWVMALHAIMTLWRDWKGRN